MDEDSSISQGPPEQVVEAGGGTVGAITDNTIREVKNESFPGNLEDQGDDGFRSGNAKVTGGGRCVRDVRAGGYRKEIQGRPEGDRYINMDDDEKDGSVNKEVFGPGKIVDDGNEGGQGLASVFGAGHAGALVDGKGLARGDGGLILVDEHGRAGLETEGRRRASSTDGVLVREQSRRDSETSVADELVSWYAGDG